MPTIRSHFSYGQFEAVLQKIAHKVAINAVKTLKHGRVRVIISGPSLREVETNEYHIKFYASHASFEKKSGSSNISKWWGFDVENKVYLTSNHCTKISFYASEDKRREKQKKIETFIAKIMAEIEPKPRFSLAEHAS